MILELYIIMIVKKIGVVTSKIYEIWKILADRGKAMHAFCRFSQINCIED